MTDDVPTPPTASVAAVKADRLCEVLLAGDVERARELHAQIGAFLEASDD